MQYTHRLASIPCGRPFQPLHALWASRSIERTVSVTRAGRGVEDALAEVGETFPPALRRRGFNRHFAEYRLRLEMIHQLLGHRLAVLDLGAGAGVTSLVLRKLGMDVVVLDTWAEYRSEYDNQMGTVNAILDRFRRFSVPTILGNLQDGLPFREKKFDLVTLYDVIEHLPVSPRKLLTDIYGVLRPGGHLVLTTPNLANLRARLRLLAGQTIHFPIDAWFDNESFYGHIREYTPRELRYMLESVGFRLQRVRLSNSLQWNTRRSNGEWTPGPRPTSAFQVAKLAYFAVTAFVPAFRYDTHVLATRPTSGGEHAEVSDPSGEALTMASSR